MLQLHVGDKVGRDRPAEGEDGRHCHHGNSRACLGNNGAHTKGEDELSEKNHAGDDGNVSPDAAHLVVVEQLFWFSGLPRLLVFLCKSFISNTTCYKGALYATKKSPDLSEEP